MIETRHSLLLRIRDPGDGRAWAEFVRIYAPLLHAYGMKNGLQDADAADLAQDTIRNVLRAAPEFVYDPARGSFRGWLFTIARNEIRKQARRAVTRGSGDSAVGDRLCQEPAPAADEAEWDREYQMTLFRWAAERVKPEFREASWQAFWRTAVLAEAVEAVAASLKMTSGAVYIARSRVTARIRQVVQSVDGGDE